MVQGIEKQLALKLVNVSKAQIMLKDANSVFWKTNTINSQFCGLKEPDAIIGKSDFDLCFAEFADAYILYDKKVLSGEIWRGFEFTRNAKADKLLFYTQKVPIIEDKKIIGVFVNALPVPSSNLALNKEIAFIDALIGQKQTRHWTIAAELEEYNLTTKETECLYYLLRGNSAKDIAKKVCRSPRTIESHIENIKVKLNCHTKNELFEKSIALGLIYVLPV